MKLSVRIVLAGAIALSLTVSVGAQAQQTQATPRTPAPVGQTQTATVTAEIQAIDPQTRAVTLKRKDGALTTLICGPEIQRFNELKVGDQVTFTYHEAVVFSIAQPGATPQPGTAVVRSAGDRPAGMIAKRETAVVTVLAIDPAVPSVTIQRADGSKMSMKVENPKNLDGVKVGDKVQVVYTQALAVSVK